MDAQTVRFRPLDTIQQASVQILDDVIVEGVEDFIGQIRILPGPSVEVLNGTTTIVIQDDDGVCVCVCTSAKRRGALAEGVRVLSNE